MSDITWRDQYDDADALADELDGLVEKAAERGYYTEATTIYNAAQALRDMHDEIQAVRNDLKLVGEALA